MTSLAGSVIFLDHSTAPGGAELALRRMLALAPADIQPILITPKGDLGIFKDPQLVVHRVGPPQRAGVTTARSPFDLLRYVRGLVSCGVSLRLNRQFRQGRVVVANTSRSAIYGYLAVFGRRVGFVVHVRDQVTAESLGRLGWFAFRWAIRRANVVIANSNFTMKEALSYIGPKTRAHVIGSLIGMEERAPRTGHIGAVRNIGMVARLDPWKGHRILIEAFEMAFADTSEELHIAGSSVFADERYESELSELVRRLGLESRVHFEGQVTDVAAFIDKIDIGVQCSLRPEPLGQNVLQYLARRCPVVVSREGGPVEAVIDGLNGLSFDPGSAAALADAMRRLAADLELRQRIARSADTGLKSDSQKSMEFYAILRSCLSMPRIDGVDTNESGQEQWGMPLGDAAEGASCQR